jgi:hypothetical protein
MKNYFFYIFCFFVFAQCKHSDIGKEKIDCINQEVFDYRNNSQIAIPKANEVLKDISEYMPDYYNGKAFAYNNLAQIYFLKNDYDTALMYIDKVKNITQRYSNKELEENIAALTLAQIYCSRRELEKEWDIYLDKLSLFQIDENKKDLLIPLEIEELDPITKKRYYFAQSEFYFGLLRIAAHNQNKEDVKSYFKNLYDENIFNPEMLDTVQMNELFYRRAYHNYIQAKDTLTETKKQIDFIENCFSDIKNWWNYISKEKDVQHLTNLYDLYARIITDKDFEHLLTAFKKDKNINALEICLTEELCCSALDSLPIYLLTEAANLSEMYQIGPLYRAWYTLQLGDFFYNQNNLLESDKWYTKYSEIEWNYIKSHNNNSLKLYKPIGYQFFLEKTAKKDSIYNKLQEIFEREKEEDFHDDEVLLNHQTKITTQLQKYKYLYSITKSDLDKFRFIFCPILVFIIILLLLCLVRLLKIVTDIKNNCNDIEAVKTAIQKYDTSKVKNKLITFIRRCIIVLILLIIIFAIVYFFHYINIYLAWISLILTIIIPIIGYFIPKMKEWFKKIW